MREPRDTHWHGKLLELFNSLRKLSKEFPQSSSLPSNPKLSAAAKETAVAGREVMGKEIWGTLSCRFLCPSATSIITLTANMFLVKKWAINESLCSRKLQLPRANGDFRHYITSPQQRRKYKRGGSKSLFKIFYTFKSFIKLSSCSFLFHHKISVQVINFKENKMCKAMPFADSSRVAAPFNTFERTPGTKERRE